ncbi:5-dehydro-4-deoxy-D-glucuronate isomerase [Microvirga puerhi]|uniref:4-deoxy-L-threo-5-hexosulose-uronate ketol-isomerase n=1 Tax=Microvirga puerhi TaxID=2876078 RepID=A0ABS7VJ66_9HYPH|nr:5-dehydro-4-deoxy-D-glucuronate isomerase [Microvirga puerhi]MBZ6075558.1 5-dehydro-4-deoxy-D-glucuronate isomerase [Microvirga puerhi]
MIEVRYGAGPEKIGQLSTEELRSTFLIENVFPKDEARLVYTHIDRMILGGCSPVTSTVEIGDGTAIGTPHLLSYREMGIANLGGPGRIEADDQSFDLANRDVLYVGRGTKRLRMQSADPNNPACFYMTSVPSQVDIPNRLITKGQSKLLELGEERRANKRSLRMYIHPQVAPSALLLMGITDLAHGSVWNTMPPHLHERRMEAYVYFDMEAEDRVVHLMGRPDETRHLMVANGDAILSPAWSIHMGAGTGPYAFVWSMTGENQEYTDVDPVPVSTLR